MKNNNKQRLFEVMEKINPDFNTNINNQGNHFNKVEYIETAYKILKGLNHKFHHLNDNELQIIAKTDPMRFIEDESNPEHIYYGGIITSDYDFFLEKTNEINSELEYYENLTTHNIKINGKDYYYYLAGGRD